ncbi:multidrug DMT transporter [Tsukamurella pulmonis]|uniref:Cytosine-specific methyltransferase n=1 Tax=Tsukamurella pulmonis TaxID=47312 RepID=A0A1H1DQ74_9ACTN|nr:DNA (cytosine-5-)-methyltransferase [Tsukamurella pulmonis]KXO92241.1 multidrug DMT transporter [Tsukamurella pulmonis]SDQ78642.1 DNA (cytosine-5)-methyltransferase 1 [Tsukamurella pulmonis]SUP21809.1 Modification methylase HaeIII [Tsukamurella pulmonis]
MRSVELFAGGGGLTLGTHKVGFSTEIVSEWNRWCCDTLRENRDAGYPLVKDIDVREGDVRDVDWGQVPDGIDLVSGGPPCQPFSSGGKGNAANDKRDMFPATTDVIRRLRPRAFIIENVRGLLRPSFSDYYEYIKLRLAHPELIATNLESWGDHLTRLQSEHTSTHTGLMYNVVSRLVNAADYGVPQQRWRVFFVGFRADVDAEWHFPAETHSAGALRLAQQDGSYWERHEVPNRHRAYRVRAAQDSDTSLQPWNTVRDALKGLPAPGDNALNHTPQYGARSYRGHTGSYIDAPAKALKAGVHGVPGGENMLLNVDNSVRYFTVREAARLQTFPDDYRLHGPWTEAMRQVGNAVPVDLAAVVARSVHTHLGAATFRDAKAARRAC